MLSMQLDILTRLIPQVTIIIFHYMKKILLKNKKKTKHKKMRGLNQNSYINKSDT